jgi:dienelactone hydrolase
MSGVRGTLVAGSSLGTAWVRSEMAEVMLFHHPQGLTPGAGDFAETLRQAGHTVHVPDLYQGRIFSTLEDGIAFAQETGIDTIVERGRAAAEQLPSELVYAGFSLGVLDDIT